jgi:hypothetical protein
MRSRACFLLRRSRVSIAGASFGCVQDRLGLVDRRRMEHSGDVRLLFGLVIGRGEHTQDEDSSKSCMPRGCISRMRIGVTALQGKQLDAGVRGRCETIIEADREVRRHKKSRRSPGSNVMCQHGCMGRKAPNERKADSRPFYDLIQCP